MKRNIKSAESYYAKVMSTVIVNYNLTYDPPEMPPRLGVIAQNEKDRWPELVSKDGEGTYSFNYMGLVMPMLQALQANVAEIMELKAQIAELRALIKR